MTKEIERKGIPVIHVTNLTKISEGIGAKRILKGFSVLHVFGRPTLPHASEMEFRKKMLERACDMLQKKPEDNLHSLIWE